MRYRFEDLELDTDLRRLTREGVVLHIQPKVFDLLEFLTLHRGRVVPKAVLFRELWPDAVVTGASLTRVVKEARRAVHDDGRSQRVIQTVHRYGYRFAAEVRTANGSGPSEGERAIELARRSLEASLDIGSWDLQVRVADFAETCLRVLQTAREQSTG